MFRGIYPITIDGKGRFALPARVRDSLTPDHNTSWVFTIDTEESCLLLYPLQEWMPIEEKLQSLPSLNVAARRIQRLLIGHATDVEMDSSSRLLLPQLLREYAKLDKHAVLIGQGNKFELWDDELWQQRRQDWLAEETSLIEGLPDEMKTISL